MVAWLVWVLTVFLAFVYFTVAGGIFAVIFERSSLFFFFSFSILWKPISSGLLCRAMGAYLLVSLPDLIFLFLFLEGRLLYMNLHTTNINYMVLSLYGSFCSAQCLVTSLYLLFWKYLDFGKVYLVSINIIIYFFENYFWPSMRLSFFFFFRTFIWTLALSTGVLTSIGLSRVGFSFFLKLNKNF